MFLFSSIKKNVASLFAFSIFLLLSTTTAHAQALTCGQTHPSTPSSCTCDGATLSTIIDSTGATQFCCGWARNNVCLASIPIDEGVTEGVTDDFFNSLNPFKIAGGATIEETAPSAYASRLDSPGEVVSRVLDFAFPIAGIILFVMITWGGFEMVIGATEKKALDAGRQRITAAIVGFLLLFASYWLAQIVQYVFGVVIV